MNTKKIARNLFYSILSQIITISLGLVVPRVILVGYGSEMNGLLNSVAQMLIYLNLFEAGVQLVAVQSLYKPVSIGDRDSINAILSAVNISYRKTGMAYLGILLILSILYPYLILNSDMHYWSVFCVVFFSGLGNVVLFFFQGKYKMLLQAEGKNYLLTNLHTIIAVLNHLAKIVCITLGYNIVTVVVASFVISMIQAVYICILIKWKYSWIDLKSIPDFDAISQKNSALVHQLAGMVFQNTDVLILTFFCGLKVVSVYSVYKLVTSHLSALLQNLYGSVGFALGQKFNTDKLAFSRIIDTVDVYFGGISFSIYTVAAVLFLPFIKLYTKGVTDTEYADLMVSLLFVIVELLTFSRMPMLNTINYAGHFKNTLSQTLIETMINLMVSLTAVYFWGIHGVLLGTIVALLYRNLDIFLYTNHNILNRSAKKTICIYGMDSIIFVLTFMCANAMRFHIESYFDFIAIGLLLTPIVILLYLVVLSCFFSEEKKMITEIAKSILSRYRQK